VSAVQSRRIPAEEIEDNSPLFRAGAKEVRPISYTRIARKFRCLFALAGLNSRVGRDRYIINIHSFRKFFKTEMTRLGVPRDYRVYAWSQDEHYLDVEALGVEYLRGIYAQADLSVLKKRNNLSLLTYWKL